MYNIPAVGEEGLLAYCDLMSFELSLKLIFHFDTDVDFFLSLWSRGQTDIYGLFREFVAPPRKKNLVTIFS